MKDRLQHKFLSQSEFLGCISRRLGEEPSSHSFLANRSTLLLLPATFSHTSLRSLQSLAIPGTLEDTSWESTFPLESVCRGAMSSLSTFPQGEFLSTCQACRCGGSQRDRSAWLPALSTFRFWEWCFCQCRWSMILREGRTDHTHLWLCGTCCWGSTLCNHTDGLEQRWAGGGWRLGMLDRLGTSLFWGGTLMLTRFEASSCILEARRKGTGILLTLKQKDVISSWSNIGEGYNMDSVGEWNS